MTQIARISGLWSVSLSESGFTGLADLQDNTCKNTNFHGGLTEVFTSVGVTCVPDTQYVPSP